MRNGWIRDCGIMEHYVNNILHYEDGPAIYSLSEDWEAWYYKGKFIDCHSQEEFERIIKLKLFW